MLDNIHALKARLTVKQAAQRCQIASHALLGNIAVLALLQTRTHVRMARNAQDLLITNPWRSGVRKACIRSNQTDRPPALSALPAIIVQKHLPKPSRAHLAPTELQLALLISMNAYLVKQAGPAACLGRIQGSRKHVRTGISVHWGAKALTNSHARTAPGATE